MWHSWGETWKINDLLEVWDRSTQFWVAWGVVQEINLSLYFSDTDTIELGTALIWIRFKTKEMIWFFVWHAVNLWSSLSKDVSCGWFQVGVKADWANAWKRDWLIFTTGLPVVPELENFCGWKWVFPVCSLFFLFPTCPLVATARGTTLLKVSPCSEAVLCSFLYYVLFLYS